MNAKIADVRKSIGYRAVCPEGSLGVVDDPTTALTEPGLVIRRGKLMFAKRYVVPLAAIRDIDHDRGVVSLNGSTADLTATPHDPAVHHAPRRRPQIREGDPQHAEVVLNLDEAGSDPLVDSQGMPLPDPTSRRPL